MGNRNPEGLSRYGLAKRYAKVRVTSAVEEFKRDRGNPITVNSMHETFQVFYGREAMEEAANRPHPFFAFVQKDGTMIKIESLSRWQADVRAFHKLLALPSGDYARDHIPGLGGELLTTRIKLIAEEVQETLDAWAACDLVEVVDGCIDIAYVVLGSFDCVGVACNPRFEELTATSAYRGWNGFPDDGLRPLAFCAAQALAMMRQHEAQGSEFKRWDLLEAVMKEISRTFQRIGIDPRPVWREVHRSNLDKQGGPVIDGKLRKPLTWSPPNVAGVLESQGVAL